MTNRRPPARPPSYDKKVALVLQGGGALGSYQAGAYEALASSEYLPDWVAGISIGAITQRSLLVTRRGRASSVCAASGRKSPLLLRGETKPDQPVCRFSQKNTRRTGPVAR